jgi:hypothetical protein
VGGIEHDFAEGHTQLFPNFGVPIFSLARVGKLSNLSYKTETTTQPHGHMEANPCS